MIVTILMGRGVEGTGNTKYAVELQEFLLNTGNTCVVYANKDKKWGREKSHENKITMISYMNEYETIIESCKGSDLVVVLSVPAKTFDTDSKDKFMYIMQQIKDAGVKTSYIQVDHKIHSINRNFYAQEAYKSFFDCLTSVITHSKDGDFTRFCKKHNITLNNLITSSDKLNGINGLDFAKYKKYWKEFEEKDYRTIKFLGRTAAWKGPWLFRDLHESHFKNAGYISTCEGIEMSIQSLQYLFVSWDPVKILRDDTTLWSDSIHGAQLDNNELVFERNHTIYMLPPYTNAYAMERMSRQQFGIELLLLDDRFLSDIMEYAMMEIVAVGTVPIFRKRWGECFKIDGVPLIEYGEETGTIFLDENNLDEALNLMNTLSDNKELYEKYRQNAFNFYSKYLTNTVIYNKLISIMMED